MFVPAIIVSRRHFITTEELCQSADECMIVSSSSGRNQAQGSSCRSLTQALSRTAVPVSLPQVRPAGVCSFSKTLQSWYPPKASAICFSAYLLYISSPFPWALRSLTVSPSGFSSFLAKRPPFSIVLKNSSTDSQAVCAIMSFAEMRFAFVVFVPNKHVLPR